MALTAAQTTRLFEVETTIAQLENILAVTSGLGSSHSAQGMSNTFSDTQIKMANAKLPQLRRIREQLNAIDADQEIPPPAGTNYSNYLPE